MSDVIERFFQLQVDADPSLALSVRVFVAESARSLGIDEGEIEDLRLLATELLANAVETGQTALALHLTTDGSAWALDAQGVGDLVAGSDNGPIDRRDVLRGLTRIRALFAVVVTQSHGDPVGEVITDTDRDQAGDPKLAGRRT